MGDGDTFSLSMDGFKENIKTSWQELQDDRYFCDVILACEEKIIQTHKVVISSCSPILGKLLKIQLTQNPHPLIYLTKVKYKDLQNVLNFMYQGELQIEEKDLPGFLELGGDLEIKGLSEDKPLDANAETNLHFNSQKCVPDQSSNGTTENEYEINPINAPIAILKQFEQNLSPVDLSKQFDKNSINNSIFPVEIHYKDTNVAYKEYNNGSLMEISGKCLSCSKCDKRFSSKSGFQDHFKAIHEGVWQYCNQCNYKAIKNNHLKVHIDSVHEGIRHPCSLCQYKATTKPALNKHILAFHEGITYSCSQCNYTSKWKHHLPEHTKKFHLNTK